MPAFFSKVFARGKEKEREKGGKDGLKEPSSPSGKQAKRFSRASATSLLEGRFEAVSPSVSPTAEKYGELDQSHSQKREKDTREKEKEKERGGGGGLFRPKSRTMSGSDASARKQQQEASAPQLKLDLNLPSPKLDPSSKKRDLSIVYEGDAVLDDEFIGEKRLSPAEALKLMRACSNVLTSRGLETLGIMHPHWHSASPAAQRRIISRFLSSLTAASSEASSPASSFDSELEFARSPHDVAAVFRWALRHLNLEGGVFDKDNSPSLAWYDGFTEKERAAEYPKTAYTDLLLPVVKPSHAELLDSTLSLVSRLASHSEWNGTSGSKLSMSFGHYLLTGNKLESIEDWMSFYSQWERGGRALEHIFLASLRDEDAKTGIPKRLLELVSNYPYSKSITDNRFPRPTRFATRNYDALYIRVTAEKTPGKRSREEVYLPLQVVENALKSEISSDSDDKELVAFWHELRKLVGLSGEEAGAADGKNVEKSLGSIFTDDSIRLLSLKSDSVDKGTPTISMFTPAPDHDALFGTPRANGRAKAANGSTSASRQTSEATASSPIAADWSVFSSAGFGESTVEQSLAATLLDNDLEKTDPPKLAARRSLKKSRSPGRAGRGDKAVPSEPPLSPFDSPTRFRTSRVSLVKIDEAFVDFWSDALLDPISDTWPNFVVCQLKSDVARTAHGESKVAWLVIEQAFVSPAPPPSLPAPPSPGRRAGSPRPSTRSDGEARTSVVSRVSATFSPRKRFNFFGSSSPAPAAAQTVSGSGSEKKESKALPKGMKVNELGEVIPEEKEAEKEKDEEKAKDKEEKPSPPTPKAEESKPAPAVPEKPKDEPAKEDAKKPSDTEAAVGAAAVAAGTGALAVAAEATVASEEGKPEVPAKEEEAKEPVKEEVAEPAPEAVPAPEKAAPEEPTMSAPAETELATAQVEEAAPEVPPPTSEPPTVEEPVPPVQEEEEPTAEHPAAAEEAEEAEAESLTSQNQGAGDSRFVEHIEVTPPEKSTVLESIEESVSAEPHAEAKVKEKASEPEVKAEPEPEVEEPKVPVEEPSETPVAAPVVEEVPEEKEADIPAPAEEPAASAAEEPAEPEPAVQAVEEDEEAAVPPEPKSEVEASAPTAEEPIKAEEPATSTAVEEPAPALGEPKLEPSAEASTGTTTEFVEKSNGAASSPVAEEANAKDGEPSAKPTEEPTKVEADS